MRTLQQIQAGFVLAVATALGLATGCTAANDPSDRSDDTSLGVTQEADEVPFMFDGQPIVPPGSLPCTLSDSGPSGRTWGYIKMVKPGLCLRMRLGGVAPDFTSCHQRGRQELGCQEIITP